MHLEVRRLLVGDVSFYLIVRCCGAYLRPGTYKKKYNKTEDAQYSKNQNKLQK